MDIDWDGKNEFLVTLNDTELHQLKSLVCKPGISITGLFLCIVQAGFDRYINKRYCPGGIENEKG